MFAVARTDSGCSWSAVPVPASPCSRECGRNPRHGLATVDSNGKLHVHPDRHAEPADWAWDLVAGLRLQRPVPAARLAAGHLGPPERLAYEVLEARGEAHTVNAHHDPDPGR
ncbi:hypothetical protein ACWGI8_21590 [Streptomyces sp. NPDC054841]